MKFTVVRELENPPENDLLSTAPTIKIVDSTRRVPLGFPEERPVRHAILVAAGVFGILVLGTLVAAIWGGTHVEPPLWAVGLTHLHGPLSHGPVLLFILAALMEVLGRYERLEHLRRSVPFVLWAGIAMLILIDLSGIAATMGDRLAGTTSEEASGFHWELALGSTIVAVIALVLRLYPEERQQCLRPWFLFAITLAIGCLLALN